MNNLLESLDGQVENAVEEQVLRRSDENEEAEIEQLGVGVGGAADGGGLTSKDAVENILARRGLAGEDEEECEKFEDNQGEQQDSKKLVAELQDEQEEVVVLQEDMAEGAKKPSELPLFGDDGDSESKVDDVQKTATRKQQSQSAADSSTAPSVHVVDKGETESGRDMETKGGVALSKKGVQAGEQTLETHEHLIGKGESVCKNTSLQNEGGARHNIALLAGEDLGKMNAWGDLRPESTPNEPQLSKSTVECPVAEADKNSTLLPTETVKTSSDPEHSAHLEGVAPPPGPDVSTVTSADNARQDVDAIEVAELAALAAQEGATSTASSALADQVAKSAKLEEQIKTLTLQLNDSRKELRKLRRNVISLNTALESTESEMGAQRVELTRAAERMERDRKRFKEEKAHLVTEHREEVKNIKSEHERLMAEQKSRSEEQVTEMRDRLKDAEELRMREGGDWTKELEDCLKREREGISRIEALEDEKSLTASHVSTLQTQLNALQSRLDSMTQTAENATEREREADDKLDAALSLHARQLSQRQAREAELERTVADLGAALVVARQRELNRSHVQKIADSSDTGTLQAQNGEEKSTKVKLESLEEELETVRAQLELERQRCLTLHQELRDMSKERNEEASEAHAKQRQQDRKVADLSSALTRLQQSMRELKKTGSLSHMELKDGTIGSESPTFQQNSEELKKQLTSISEQTVRQQEKLAGKESEIVALRNRLRTALMRADTAEKALASSENASDMYDLEQGVSGSYSSKVRRRAGGCRAKEEPSGAGSIRSAIKLDSGRGSERKEQIGRAIDALDSFSVETGAYLRYNPLARGGFLLYLILLHFWTLFLLVFHVHTYQSEHKNFGENVHHSPHALMNKQQLPNPP